MSERFSVNKEQLREQGLITSRMWDIPDKVASHPVIARYIACDSRFIICSSGRRSMKTEIAKRKLMQKMLQGTSQQFLVFMPTHNQVKNIWFDGALNFCDLFPRVMIKDRSETELYLKLFNDNVVHFVSAEAARRTEGRSCYGAIIDEAGDVDLDEVYQRTIMPMLSDTRGFLWFIGVPRQDMGIQYKELWNKYKDGTYDDWKCFTWPSAVVLNQDELKMVKSQIDPRTYAVEYCGEFADTISGMAYYRFDREDNIKEVLYNPELPISLCFDFNIGIMVPQLAQVASNGFITLIDEVVDRYTNLYQIIPKVKQRLIEMSNGDEQMAKSRKLFIYGDYSGVNKTVTSRASAWQEMSELFAGWNFDIRIKPNPKIDRRVSLFNAKLKDANDAAHMVISPKCVELLKDMEFVSYDDLSRQKESVGERTHASDSVGYMIYYNHSEYGV